MNIKAKVSARDVKAFRLSSEDIKALCSKSGDIRKIISLIIDSITKLKDSLKPTSNELDKTLKSLPGKIKKIQEEIKNCESRLKDKEQELKSLEKTLATTPKSIEIELPNGKTRKAPNPEYYEIKSQIRETKAEIGIIKSELYNLKTKLEYAKKLETRISAMKISVENTVATLESKINRCRQIDNEVEEVFGKISKFSDSAISNLKAIEKLIEEYLKKKMRYNDTYICPAVRDTDRIMDLVDILDQKKEKPSLLKRFIEVIKNEIKEELSSESEKENENYLGNNEPDRPQLEEELQDNEDYNDEDYDDEDYDDEDYDDEEVEDKTITNNYYNVSVTRNIYNVVDNFTKNHSEQDYKYDEIDSNEETSEIVEEYDEEIHSQNIYGYTDEEILLNNIEFDGNGHISKYDGKSFGGEFNSYEFRLNHTASEEYGYYTGDRGESLFVPYENNAKGVKVRQILREYGLKGIEYRNAEPDFELCCVETVIIDDMCERREDNFLSADKKCSEKWNACSRFGISNWTAKKVKRYRQENWLTWHEKCDTKTMVMVRREINDYFDHSGGVAECKKRDGYYAGGYDE